MSSWHTGVARILILASPADGGRRSFSMTWRTSGPPLLVTITLLYFMVFFLSPVGSYHLQFRANMYLFGPLPRPFGRAPFDYAQGRQDKTAPSARCARRGCRGTRLSSPGGLGQSLWADQPVWLNDSPITARRLFMKRFGLPLPLYPKTTKANPS